MLPAIIKSVKGRLQHLIRASHSKAFKRNFSLSGVGDSSRAVIEEYVASQLGHHVMADERVQTQLLNFQLSFPGIDLKAPLFSSHGRYLYNLNLVLVHAERWREISEKQLTVTRNSIVQIASAKNHRLSRAAILAYHIHLTIGCPFDQSPSDVGLAYLNNLAYAHGMQPRYSFSYYVGAFGEYDMGAMRKVAASHGPTDTGSVVA